MSVLVFLWTIVYMYRVTHNLPDATTCFWHSDQGPSHTRISKWPFWGFLSRTKPLSRQKRTQQSTTQITSKTGPTLCPIGPKCNKRLIGLSSLLSFNENIWIPKLFVTGPLPDFSNRKPFPLSSAHSQIQKLKQPGTFGLFQLPCSFGRREQKVQSCVLFTPRGRGSSWCENCHSKRIE